MWANKVCSLWVLGGSGAVSGDTGPKNCPWAVQSSTPRDVFCLGQASHPECVKFYSFNSIYCYIELRNITHERGNLYNTERKNTELCNEILLPVYESANDGSGGNGWVCRSLPGPGIFSGGKSVCTSPGQEESGMYFSIRGRHGTYPGKSGRFLHPGFPYIFQVADYRSEKERRLECAPHEP